MIDSDLFLFYDLLKKQNPGLSKVGFSMTLEQFSVSKGRVSLKYVHSMVGHPHI